MSPNIFPECPGKDSPALDWNELRDAYPWVREMARCPQNPTYHAEGSVEVHTRLVVESLLESPAWSTATDEERDILFATALLHDIGKLSTTREEGGIITSRGHSVRGEIEARRILWEMQVPFRLREQVCALIRFHQNPFWLMESDDPERKLYQISLSARCDLLAIQAEADAQGRIGEGRDRMLDSVALFRLLAEEKGVLTGPKHFPSAHTRVEYFRSEGRLADYEVYDDTRGDVILMCALPGSGKDTWIADHVPELPVVSLDAIRREEDYPPTGNQGPIVSLAKERARQHMRASRPFVWNATNLSRQIRSELIALFADYRYRIRIQYVEVPPATLFHQNGQRDGVERVPSDAYARMFRRWEMPDRTEAHRVDYFVRD